MSGSVLRVAAAQIDARRGDLEANLARHLEMIERSHRESVELLVFPELSLSGYPMEPEDIGRDSIPREGPYTEELSKAAAGMLVMVGFIEETHAAQFHNATMVLHEGELVHLHRKLNLATYGHLEEGKYFAGGRYIEPLDIGGPWRLASLICADLWNPALVHLAALHGTTLLVGPMSSAHGSVSSEFSNPDGWSLLSRFYAMIYGFPLVLANRVGKEKHLGFWGGSRIVDPFGNTLAHAGESEELLVADLEYEQVRKARLRLPTVRDSNLALVVREITRLERRVGVPDPAAKHRSGNG
jgi:N-carbamoylputrescine amidase